MASKDDGATDNGLQSLLASPKSPSSSQQQPLSDGTQRAPTPLPKGRLFTLFLLTLNESFSEVHSQHLIIQTSCVRASILTMHVCYCINRMLCGRLCRSWWKILVMMNHKVKHACSCDRSLLQSCMLFVSLLNMCIYVHSWCLRRIACKLIFRSAGASHAMIDLMHRHIRPHISCHMMDEWSIVLFIICMG